LLSLKLVLSSLENILFAMPNTLNCLFLTSCWSLFFSLKKSKMHKKD
jgi:hypothetical protein